MRNKIDYRYFRQIISQYLDHFLEERMGVLRSSDIEPVHRMRVASRRLRAALSVFKSIFPAKKTRFWKKEISKIGLALGAARQLDVQIRFLESLKNRPKDNFNTEALIELLKKRRMRAQKQIDIVLKDFEVNKVILGLKNSLKEICPGANKQLIDAFNLEKGAIILKRLDSLMEFGPYVFKPESVKELHHMRIAAKKLRYALEILRPWYGARFDKYIRASRNIQDLLGDLHEFDCLAATLSDYSRKQNKDFDNAGIDLIRECIRLRKGIYVKFLRLWKEIEKSRLWVKLRKEI